MAAATLLLTTTAIAQQGPPASPAAQPPVSLGVSIEEDPQGPRIGAVTPGRTAAAIGMQAGDILLQVGGRAVTEPQDVSRYLQSLKVGDPVSIIVRRGARTIELTGPAVAGPPGSGPPPDRSTPVEAGELRETWNDLVSQGPPVDAFPEFEG